MNSSQKPSGILICTPPVWVLWMLRALMSENPAGESEVAGRRTADAVAVRNILHRYQMDAGTSSIHSKAYP